MNDIKSRNKLNPNPITKFLALILMGFTIVNPIGLYLELLIIGIISILYFINGFKKEALKNLFIFCFFSLIPSFKVLEKLPLAIKLFLSVILVFRMFYLPYAGGKFLIKTSDVGSIISSLDVLRISKNISIPVAVMFRFFPAFSEEKNNIKMAMKIRGIETKNPIKYLEYVLVPLLVISSNIADDIAKAAETKCIANPIKKTRYISIKIQVVDFIYGFSILAIVLGAYLCLH